MVDAGQRHIVEQHLNRVRGHRAQEQHPVMARPVRLARSSRQSPAIEQPHAEQGHVQQKPEQTKLHQQAQVGVVVRQRSNAFEIERRAAVAQIGKLGLGELSESKTENKPVEEHPPRHVCEAGPAGG